ncbi:Lipase (class 3) [Eubacterium ruminantium]|nr:Lipase (class 3) [Eubacterium ruminantium]
MDYSERIILENNYPVWLSYRDNVGYGDSRGDDIMNNKVKKIIALLMVIPFLMGIFLCGSGGRSLDAKTGDVSVNDPVTKGNVLFDKASGKGSSRNIEEWAEKYIDYIRDHTMYDDYSGYYLDPNDTVRFRTSTTFELIYVDDDDIPEVLTSGADEATGMGIIYINSNGKVDFKIIYRHGFAYIERTGLVMNNSGNTGYYYTYIYKLENHEFKELGSGNYQDQLNGNTVSMKYSWNGRELSEDAYWKEVDKLFDRSKYTPVGDTYMLNYTYVSILTEILKKGIVYSDIDWIRAYQEFLVNEDYRNFGQEFGNATEMSGKFYDMDHDGIPELILNNGYSDGVRSGKIFAYIDGTVKYLDNGPIEAYISCKEGFKGLLYGYYSESGYISSYEKNGTAIKIETVGESSNWSGIDREYAYLSSYSIELLVSELSAYGDIYEETTDYPESFYELDKLLGKLGWVGNIYDYKDTAGERSAITYFFGNLGLKELFIYPGDIEKYNSWKEDYSSVIDDPKAKYQKSYRQLDGAGADWILKNIYNVNDDVINEFHNADGNDNSSFYYYNNDYYAFLGGVGGGYSAYVSKLEKLGGVYHITYYQIIYPDGPGGVFYEKMYALAAYKKIDGVKYWSLYKTSTEPLYDEADKIDVGFQISEEYLPYPTVALKARSNGCYVTCDIGSKDSEGKYTKYDKPDMNVNATSISGYELFEKVRLNGGFALQSSMIRKYLTGRQFLNDPGVYVKDEIIQSHNKLVEVSADGGKKIRFDEKNEWGQYVWLVVKDGKLQTDVFEDKAEIFDIITVDDNMYDAAERNILSSGEWIKLNGIDECGYWNMQYEIGLKNGDNTKALRGQNYTLITPYGNKDVNYITSANMQCAAGVKYEDGMYDVIIAFQGTGGFSGDMTGLVNLVLDGLSNITSSPSYYCSVKTHSGYKGMSDNLAYVETVVRSQEKVNGRYVTLRDLIKEAAKGKARFTILGHSMGGAIAQIYALRLHNCNIPASAIRGRTFNSALAFAEDVPDLGFTDWYNLCVTTDTVTNGFVQNSLKEYGIHRLGKTIWLYDNEPDANYGDKSFNIYNGKHNMDTKIQEILRNLSITYYGYEPVSDEMVFTTNKYNVPVYERPKKDADPVDYIDDMDEVIDMESSVINDVGNMWYKTKDGRFIYQNNLNIQQKQRLFSMLFGDFNVKKDNAPLREGITQDTDVIEYLKKDTIVSIEYLVDNSAGNTWARVEVNGKSGWIYFQNLGQSSRTARRKIKTDCPVNVKLYNSSGEVVSSIINGETVTNDENKIKPYVIGRGKYFEIYDDDEYRVEIDSLSDGLMDYAVYSDYDEEQGDFKEKKEFEGAALEPDMRFESKTGGNIRTEDVKLSVIDENGKVIDDIGVDGSSAKEEEKAKEIAGDVDGKSKKSGIILIIIIAAVVVVAAVLIAVFLFLRKKKRKTAAQPVQQSQQYMQQQSQQYPQQYMMQTPQQYPQQQVQPQQYPQQSAHQPVQQIQSQQQHFEGCFCSMCGARLSPEQIFCSVCGNKRQ